MPRNCRFNVFHVFFSYRVLILGASGGVGTFAVQVINLSMPRMHLQTIQCEKNINGKELREGVVKWQGTAPSDQCELFSGVLLSICAVALV